MSLKSYTPSSRLQSIKNDTFTYHHESNEKGFFSKLQEVNDKIIRIDTSKYPNFHPDSGKIHQIRIWEEIRKEANARNIKPNSIEK